MSLRCCGYGKGRRKRGQARIKLINASRHTIQGVKRLSNSCRGGLVHPRRLPRGERGVWGGTPGLVVPKSPLQTIAVREHQYIKSREPLSPAPWNVRLGRLLFIVRPHPEHANDAFFDENLIDQAMLDIDAPRIGTRKITNQLLVGRRILEWIVGKYCKQLLGF